MIRPYRTLLSAPGAPSFICAGLVTRLPLSMITLATLLLVQRATSSFAMAGAVLAVSGLAHTVASPLLARQVDRHGQRAVLRPTVIIHALGVVGLVSLCQSGAPLWTYFPAAAVSGAMCPAAGTLVRARWAAMLDGTDRLHTAFAWESAVDELLYLAGPALVTLVAAAISPALPLLAGATLTVFGGFWLARTATAPCATLGACARKRVLSPGLVVVAAVLAAVGALCGSISVLISADVRALGHAGLAGPLLGLWALGSLLSGLAYGAIRWRSRSAPRFLTAVALFAAGTLPLALAARAGSIVALALAMLVAGMTVSPVFITAYALVTRLVAADARTRGMALVGMGMSVSGAAAGAAAGVLVEVLGAHPALALAVLSGPLALGVALLGYAALRRPAAAVVATPVPRLPAPRQATESLGVAA